MAPNSLIFLVIIGVWAAYLGKYWLRRRDHLATARSMDRFSESIRVLGQGRAAPTTEVRREPHRSYVLTPGGTMRPQVTVKRSTPATPEPTDHEISSAPRDDRAPAARRVARPVRGILLLGALGLFVLSLPLALFWSRFPTWGPVVLLANVVAAFAFLRAAVQQDIAARRRVAAPRATAARTATARTAVTRPGAAPATRSATSTSAAAAPTPDDAAPVAAPAPAAAADEVFDDPTLAPASATTERPAATGIRTQDPVPVDGDDDIPATWDPRPVPTPTYAMKQRADHPVPPPAAVPVPVQLDEDDDVDFGRRASGA